MLSTFLLSYEVIVQCNSEGQGLRNNVFLIIVITQ